MKCSSEYVSYTDLYCLTLERCIFKVFGYTLKDLISQYNLHLKKIIFFPFWAVGSLNESYHALDWLPMVEIKCHVFIYCYFGNEYNKTVMGSWMTK